MSHFLASLPRQLRFWSFHCVLNALPSFVIALLFLKLVKNPQAVVAMLCAIGFFILLYSAVTAIPGPLSNEAHVFSRSLKLGAKIRAWISAISVVAIPMGGMAITPDFWAGWLAAILLDKGMEWMGMTSHLLSQPENAGFAAVFATTLLEGVILSMLLLTISFFSILFIQTRDRKRAFLNPTAGRVHGI